MEFFRSATNWLGNFVGGIFQDLSRQVYYRTGHSGALGFILFLFKKWYLIVMVPAITALYWVIKGLDDLGVISGVENFVMHHLNVIVDIAHYCTPKIFDKSALLDCLNNPNNGASGFSQDGQ